MKYGKLVGGLCVVALLLAGVVGYLAAGIPGAVVGPLILSVILLIEVG